MPDAALDAGANPRRHVVALLYDGLCTFEFGIVAEVFGLPRPEMEDDWYSFGTASVEAGPLRATGGIRVECSRGLDALVGADTVVVPGWRGMDEPVPEQLASAIADAYAAGSRLVSICSGAYVLAAAGLLDGRRAATHWRYAEDIQRKYPSCRIELDRLYVDEDNIYTSAGSSAGIDVCLHIVRNDFGPEIANRVARRLVMHAHRQGGQAQFIDQPVPLEYEANRLSDTIDFARAHLDKRHTVASLADRAHMSARTFQRRFAALVGMPVGQWLVQERLARASDLLQSSDSSLAAISSAVGFSNISGLQYHFRKAYGVSPGEYRKRFASV
ncbi:MAG: transcriptional regulator FtrA [Pseudomonadota bacterium]